MTDTFSVLFRAAAGPRIGFGHLVRCRSLARVLGVAPVVSLRGAEPTRRFAADAGWQLAGSAAATVRALRPSVLVVDDPSAAHAGEWIRFGRAAGVPVAAIHDLGLAYVESDLGIDGSIRPRASMRGRVGDLKGPAYAILDPAIAKTREHGRQPEGGRVLIALGGGSDVCRLAADLVSAIAAAAPGTDIRIARGFSSGTRPELPGARWVDAPDGLAGELSRASVAVVAGGVTLYEACALGVPVVGLAITDAQHVTIREFALRAAAVDAGAPDYLASRSGVVAAAVADLLHDGQARASLSAAAQRLLDGRGVYRVAEWLRRLAAPRQEHTDAA